MHLGLSQSFREKDGFSLRFTRWSWANTPPLFSLGIWPWKIRQPLIPQTPAIAHTLAKHVHFYSHHLFCLPSRSCAGTASISGAGKIHLLDLTAHWGYIPCYQPHKNVNSTGISAALDWVTVPPCCACPPRSWTAAQHQEYNPGVCTLGFSMMHSNISRKNQTDQQRFSDNFLKKKKSPPLKRTWGSEQLLVWGREIFTNQPKGSFSVAAVWASPRIQLLYK